MEESLFADCVRAGQDNRWNFGLEEAKLTNLSSATVPDDVPAYVSCISTLNLLELAS